MIQNSDQQENNIQTPEGTTHLGFPLIDACPCGTKMTIVERQELVFSVEKRAWMRVCRDCLKKDHKFISDTSGMS